MLYLLITWRLVGIGNMTRDVFGKLYCFSFATAFFVYVVVNMGMVLGLIPIVGAPLPILSYGIVYFFNKFLFINSWFPIKLFELFNCRGI